MIRHLLLSSVVLATASASAFAADLPSRRAPPVYIPPPLPVFSWTGAYFGVNAGYAFDVRRRYTFANNSLSTSSNGFTGGGQIGYNYELGGAGVPGFGGGFNGGGIVVGVEADAAYTDTRKNTSVLAATVNGRQDYLGTVRGRAGFAIGTLLVYGTGGFAYGGVQDSIRLGNFAYGSRSSTRTGYAAGGGVEYAIPTGSFVNVFNAGAVTLKAEYLHYDLGTTNLAVGPFNTRIRQDGNLVRAGLNYKLNFLQPAPVVARY